MGKKNEKSEKNTIFDFFFRKKHDFRIFFQKIFVFPKKKSKKKSRASRDFRKKKRNLILFSEISEKNNTGVCVVRACEVLVRA